MNRDVKVDKKLLNIARKQFCLDIAMDWSEYWANPDKMCYIQKTVYKEDSAYPLAEGARCYEGKDSFFKAIMCMGQLFLSVDEQIYDWAVENFQNYTPEWFCEYSNLRRIDNKLKEYGREIADTHVYYLPCESDVCNSANGMILAANTVNDTEHGQAKGQSGKCETCGRAVVWYEQDEILKFCENNRFKSAICFSATQPDALAVAAVREEDTQVLNDIRKKIEYIEREAEAQTDEKIFDQSKLAGMAGVSADGKYLWQIGINVDKDYQGKGLAADLVSLLKEEILRRGKVPFYGTSESHTVSQTVALKAGFAPAWTEIYVKKAN